MLSTISNISPNLCLGYDVIAQAQSGTGKTATFAISILQQIELDLKATQALVLAPTRELAQQVSLPFFPWRTYLEVISINQKSEVMCPNSYHFWKN